MVDAFKTRKVGYSEYMALKLQENDIRYESREEGREEGRIETKIDIARNMKRDHVDIASIIKYTGLTKEEILAL